MLSNNGLCLRAVVQYVLLFLVWFKNSNRFQILHALTLATRSYVLLQTLCKPLAHFLLDHLGRCEYFAALRGGFDEPLTASEELCL